MLRVLGVGRVQVESRACAGGRIVSMRLTDRAAVRTGSKVPIGVFTLDAGAPRGGVGEEYGDALFCGGAEEAALLGTVQWQGLPPCATGSGRAIGGTYPLSSVQVRPER